MAPTTTQMYPAIGYIDLCRALTGRLAQLPNVAMEAGASAKIIAVHAPTMVASVAGYSCRDRHIGTMPNDEVKQLRVEVEHLSNLLLKANDAAFALAGIIGRVLVDGGAIGRQEFAEAIDRKAGDPGTEDHNPLLTAFARAVRMNFPGGRFDVIEGGATEVDTDRS